MLDGLTTCEVSSQSTASAFAIQAEAPGVERPSADLAERQEQFSALSTSVANALYRRALRWSGNHAQAEDLVQETYLSAWRNFDHFRMGTCFGAWVFQILRFHALNRRRSVSARQMTTDFQSDDALHGSRLGEAPEADAFGDDLDALVPDLVDDVLKSALDALTPDQRVLTLRISLGGFSYRECASALGIPIGTVMSRYWRARESLQQRLRQSTAFR